VTVGPNTNSGHVTSVYAYTSQRLLQLQSEGFSTAHKQLPTNKSIEKSFGSHGISLFTELLIFVYYSYLVELW